MPQAHGSTGRGEGVKKFSADVKKFTLALEKFLSVSFARNACAGGARILACAHS
jgi:hypothetical protein